MTIHQLVMYMETPVNVTDKIVLDSLQPDTDYNFMVTAKFDDGDSLASEPTKIRTPSGDIQCHCAHACMFEEDEEGVITASCYCHNGFKLADDKKLCESIEEDEEGGIVQVTPPTLTPESEHPKELSTMSTLFDDLERERESKTEPSPTDGFGGAVWQDEQLVTTDASRESVNTSISPLSTDSGQQHRVLSPVVDFDGIPLPTDEYGHAVDNLGNPIMWNDEGQPIGPNGTPLRRNYKGEYIYPVVGKDGQPLPTDINMKPIYPVIGPDNQPFRKNQEGMHIDQYGRIIPTDTSGRPISVDGSPYPTDEHGRYVVDSETIIQQDIPTDELGRVIYPVFYPDGMLLPTVEDGRFVNEHGQLIPTSDAGLPVNEKDESNKMGRIIGPSGQLVPVNNYGHPVDESNTILPTTSDGIFILPMIDGRSVAVSGTEQRKGAKRPLSIIGPNGHLLPTMEDGTVLDPFGKIIPTNNIGEPVNYRNEPLPTDSDGQAIYPKDGLDCPLPPTDEHGRPVYSVVGPDGRLLARKHDGTVLDPDGNSLPTNAAGVPVDSKGRPLPSDRNGSIIYPARGIDTEPLPTDSNGKPVYPVIGIDGSLLPTDRDGRVIEEDGKPLPTNAAGVPVNEQGEPLPFDQNGYIRYPVTTERRGKPTYIIIGTDGEPLPRNEDGLIIGPNNRPVPTDASGYPVDHGGRPLPRDQNGNIIYPANGIDVEPMPTDRNGRPVYLVIGPDGQLLPKDSDGAVTDADGRPIPTNAAGVPLDHYGKPLSVDRNGYVFYPKQSYESDRTGVLTHSILGPDGALLQQNAEGAFVDPYGRPIPTNSNGYPIDNHGRLLPKDRLGNFIYPGEDLDMKLVPTDANGRPAYSVIGPNGELLLRGYSGEILDPYGKPIPTNAVGIPVNSQGEPLPRDKQGNFIYPASGLDIKLPSTDKFGKAVYPAVDSHGEFLPTNEDGVLVDFDGSPIPTNTFGLPVDEHGKSLPKDAKGNFISGTPMRPTGQRGFPIHTVIGPNGELLPTEESGRVIGPDGHPISIDSKGRPINNRGETLPTDRSGNFFVSTQRGLPLDGQGEPLPTNAAGVPIDDHGKPLPIDSNGNLVYREEVQKPLATEEMYPVIGPDEELLPDDGVGVTVDGQSSPTDKGIPVGDIGRPLSEDFSDKMIQVGPNIESLPTDSNGRPVYPVVGPDREPLPTNEDGAVVDKNGLVIPTNAGGVPVDEKGVPLPTDENGKMIYQKPAVEAHATERLGRPTYNVIGPDGNYLLLDGDGAVLDPDGKPIPTDESGVLVDMKGRPLPKDRDGNIIYIAKGLDMKPLPTDQNGKPIYSIMGRDKVPLPTNEVGRPVDGKGKPIPTNAAGVPIGNNGKPLPTKGNLYYLATSMPMASSRPVIGPERMPLPTSSDSSIFGTHGKLLVTDQSGWPLDKPLPTDVYNNIIYPVKLPDGSTLPIDSHGRPIYPVIGPNGELLPTTEGGLIIGLGGSPLPTNFAGKPVGPDASLLPTDEIGRFIHLPPEEPLSTFVTNEYGHIVHPIVDTDGRPLAKDDSGAHITKNGIQ
uniref:Fibronectin type-III domain-containing protein n=1 Tax=Loa loa TaxID=7209 RepID=A0A1I7VXY4_LOALO